MFLVLDFIINGFLATMVCLVIFVISSFLYYPWYYKLPPLLLLCGYCINSSIFYILKFLPLSSKYIFYPLSLISFLSSIYLIYLNLCYLNPPFFSYPLICSVNLECSKYDLYFFNYESCSWIKWSLILSILLLSLWFYFYNF